MLGRHVDIGAEVAAGLQGSHAVSARLSLKSVSLSRAEQMMNTFIPSNFTDSLLAAYDLAPAGATSGKPTVRILSNPRAGNIGVSQASGGAQPALQVASFRVGSELTKEAAALGRSPVSAANPLTVRTTMFDPLPPNSALGLSAFYVALLSIRCGLLAAILVHTTVDSALVYGVTEIGPKWSQRLPVAITLFSKWVVAHRHRACLLAFGRARRDGLVRPQRQGPHGTGV